MSEPKTNYDHAHVLLATASAVAAGIPAADAAFLAAVAAIEQHFWSDAEGCARESWNADFTERARPGEELRGQAREDAIIEAARALNDLDIDLLKLEYPGSPEGCRRLAEILDRPWAVLSAGVPFDQFTDIIRIAADEGGASGLSPAAPCGARWWASPVTTAKSSSPPWPCPGWENWSTSQHSAPARGPR